MNGVKFNTSPPLHPRSHFDTSTLVHAIRLQGLDVLRRRRNDIMAILSMLLGAVGSVIRANLEQTKARS